MNRKAAAGVVTLLLIAAALLLWGVDVMDNIRRKATLEKRISDVQALSSLYVELLDSNRPLDMETLVAELRNRGKLLKNPLAIDPDRPLYRLSAQAKTNTLEGFTGVLVEETENVSDRRLVVRGYGDGAVRIERRE
jgi:hypothetical protein